MRQRPPELFDLLSKMLPVLIVGGVAASIFQLLATKSSIRDLLNESHLVWWLSTALTVSLMLFASMWIRILNRHAFPLKVALLGAPKAGKTVYLTMLFRELPSFSNKLVAFQPYGLETIEAVSRNINSLTSGVWLKPTSEDSVFFFRANATVGNSIFKRRYTVEIGDYAGEKLAEFDSSSERWLHRSEYFKYAVGCDVLFLAVDGAILANGNLREIEDMQMKLIAAVQVLIATRQVEPGRKLKMPVGLIVMKSDLLTQSNLGEILRTLDRLVSVCRNNCRSFKTFLVSAIGYENQNKEGVPPSELNPVDVMNPMLWALTQYRRQE